MIPKKIEMKLKAKCAEDKKAFNVLMDILDYVDQENGKQNIYCKEQVEIYAKESEPDENNKN